MILTRVRLFNVGSFAGEHEILLETTNARPVVLIGGMNGAGKTTLFNSILIGLYGRGWQAPQSAAEYEAQLRSLTHRSPGQRDGQDAFIEVAFRHTHLGQEEDYVVRRGWRVTAKTVREQVEVRESGKSLDGIDPDYWNQFVRELIPRGVSNLFFFDGEKVKDLASDDEAHALALKDAFDALLGLDVVEQLRMDLAHVISDQQADESHDLHSLVKQRNETIRAQETVIQKIRADRTDLKGKVEKFRREADHWEQELGRTGGVFATKREEYKAKRVELEKSIKNQEARLVELASGALPFSLAPSASRTYLRQVQREQDAVKAEAAKDTVVRLQRSITAKLTADKGKLFKNDAAKQSAIEALRTTFDQYKRLPDTPVRHGYSSNESEAVLVELGHRMPRLKEEAHRVARQLQKLRRSLNRVKSFLSKVPDDAEHQAKIQTILHRLGEAARKAAHFEAALGEEQQRLADAEAELDRLINDRDAMDAKLRQATNYVSSIHRAAACRAALREYQERLRAARRATLQEHLVECLSLLTNKEGTYKQIDLNENMRLSVRTRDGNSLDFTELSAGERQVLATALLWALSKTSGRPLPFVIDTPLGRLDSLHRGQLVERFYPQAGHQVVILSTDTEISDDYAGRLKAHVGRSYLLEYDAKKERTTVKSGYFGGRS